MSHLFQVWQYFQSSGYFILGPFTQWSPLELGLSSQANLWDFCLFDSGPYQKYMLTSLLPAIFVAQLLVIGLFHLLFDTCRTRLQSSRPRNSCSPHNYSRTLMALLIASYTGVTDQSITFLHCIDIGKNSVVAGMPSIRCDRSPYAQYKIWTLLVLTIYVISGPIVMVFGLIYANWKGLIYPKLDSTSVSDPPTEQRRTLRSTTRAVSTALAQFVTDVRIGTQVLAHAPSSVEVINSEFQRRWGPLYEMYKPHMFWFEGFALLRRCCLVLIGTFAEVRLQGVLFAVVCIFNYLGHSYFRPFRSRRDNLYESVSLLLLCVIACLNASYRDKYPLEIRVVIVGVYVLPLSLFFLKIVKESWPNVLSVQKAGPEYLTTPLLPHALAE